MLPRSGNSILILLDTSHEHLQHSDSHNDSHNLQVIKPTHTTSTPRSSTEEIKKKAPKRSQTSKRKRVTQGAEHSIKICSLPSALLIYVSQFLDMRTILHLKCVNRLVSNNPQLVPRSVGDYEQPGRYLLGVKIAIVQWAQLIREVSVSVCVHQAITLVLRLPNLRTLTVSHSKIFRYVNEKKSVSASRLVVLEHLNKLIIKSQQRVDDLHLLTQVEHLHCHAICFTTLKETIDCKAEEVLGEHKLKNMLPPALVSLSVDWVSPDGNVAQMLRERFQHLKFPTATLREITTAHAFCGFTNTFIQQSCGLTHIREIGEWRLAKYLFLPTTNCKTLEKIDCTHRLFNADDVYPQLKSVRFMPLTEFAVVPPTVPLPLESFSYSSSSFSSSSSSSSSSVSAYMSSFLITSHFPSSVSLVSSSSSSVSSSPSSSYSSVPSSTRSVPASLTLVELFRKHEMCGRECHTTFDCSIPMTTLCCRQPVFTLDVIMKIMPALKHIDACPSTTKDIAGLAEISTMLSLETLRLRFVHQLDPPIDIAPLSRCSGTSTRIYLVNPLHPEVLVLDSGDGAGAGKNSIVKEEKDRKEKEEKEEEEGSCIQLHNVKYVKFVKMDVSYIQRWVKMLAHFPCLEHVILKFHTFKVTNQHRTLVYRALHSLKYLHTVEIEGKYIAGVAKHNSVRCIVVYSDLYDVHLISDATGNRPLSKKVFENYTQHVSRMRKNYPHIEFVYEKKEHIIK